VELLQMALADAESRLASTQTALDEAQAASAAAAGATALDGAAAAELEAAQERTAQLQSLLEASQVVVVVGRSFVWILAPSSQQCSVFVVS
jgi:hypothetical protein